MKLVIDIGNSLVKAGVFEKKQLLKSFTSPEITTGFINEIIKEHHNISFAILSSVTEVPLNVINILNKSFRFIEFNSKTKVPVTNLYKTPETLGKDRLAGVVAAQYLYPAKNVLVVDAGTCITYDLINKKGEYYGGSISPGLAMRFNSLHTLTGKLPLVSLSNFNELIGTDTEKSILSGVINGVLAEADEIINKYKNIYSPLKTIICGGDAQYLAVRLKSSIFAVPELILIGLNEILDYNE